MDKRFALTVLLVGGILSGLLLYAMPCGPWAFSDSAAYLATAQNLAAGKGSGYFSAYGNFKPLTLHPPLYPLLISFMVFAGMPALQAAAWLNLLAFVLWFTISAWLIYRITGSKFFALIPCLVVVSYTDFLSVFTGAMSESIFVLFSFSGLLLLTDRLWQPQAKALVLPASLLALALLTRYIGTAFILTATVLILLFRKDRWYQRVLKAGIFALLASLPLIIWLVLSSSPGERPGGRIFSPATDEILLLQNYLNSFKDVIVNWIPYINRLTQFISVDARLLILTFTAVTFTGVQLILIRRKTSEDEFTRTLRLSFALLFLSFIYFVIHLTQYVFFSPPPDINGRVFAPLIISGIFYVYTCIRAGVLLSTSTVKWMVLFVAFALTLIIPYYQRPRTVEYLGDMHREGLGFTEVRYCQSEIINELKTIPDEYPLLSNEPAFPLLYINRMAIRYPFSNPPESYFLLLLRRPLEEEVGTQQAENILAGHRSECQTQYSDLAGAIFFCSK